MAGTISWFSLINGPFAGNYPAEDLQKYASKGAIRLPVDEQYKITDDSAFALAHYDVCDIPGEGVQLYSFRKFVKLDESPFLVEFVGGPLAGTRPFFQPVNALPSMVIAPVASRPAKGQEGRVRVFAIYRNDSLVGGENKLVFVGEHRDTVKTTRIIFEMVGGPFDGITYDTDAVMLDHQNAFWADGHYLVTSNGQIGKRFVQHSPHFMSALEEYGEQAIKYGGPYTPHIYEVFERLDEPFEVYVRARFIGLMKNES